MAKYRKSSEDFPEKECILSGEEGGPKNGGIFLSKQTGNFHNHGEKPESREESCESGERSSEKGERSTGRGEEPPERGEKSAGRGEEPPERGEKSTGRGEEPPEKGEKSAGRGEEPPERGEKSTGRGEEPSERGEESTERGEGSTKRGEESPDNAAGSARNGKESPRNKITEGVIWKQLLLFFFPILFGTFFQQLYNAVDAMIVGRFVGKVALSAVGGGTGTVIQVLVGFFVGLSSGATVIISQYYGAKKEDMVGYAVHTSIAFSVVAGIVMMAGGILAAPAVLRAMNTPADVLGPSVLYIRIYFAGIIGNLIYNMGAGILRAVGDSRRPLYFLIAGCMTNIVLDALFVIVFKMGVAGAALATILSQALSAVLVIVVLMRTQDMHRLVPVKIRLDGRMIRRIVRIGFPAGLQSIMYSSSNVIIQAGVNALGTDTVAAWTAYSKIDSVFWMMVSAFGISVTTFVGQNYGAGKQSRVHRGVRVCMGLTFGATFLISFVLYNWGVHCYQLFVSEPEVITVGIGMMRFLVPMYFTYVSIEILSGALRGVGDCWIPTLLSCLGICVLRIVWIAAVVPLRPDIYNIMFSYPLTWVVTSILFIVYYLFFSRLSRFRSFKHTCSHGRAAAADN